MPDNKQARDGEPAKPIDLRIPYVEIPEWLLAAPVTNTAKVVAAVILDRERRNLHPGYRELAELLETCRDAIGDAIQSLAREKIFVVEHRHGCRPRYCLGEGAIELARRHQAGRKSRPPGRRKIQATDCPEKSASVAGEAGQIRTENQATLQTQTMHTSSTNAGAAEEPVRRVFADAGVEVADKLAKLFCDVAGEDALEAAQLAVTEHEKCAGSSIGLWVKKLKSPTEVKRLREAVKANRARIRLITQARTESIPVPPVITKNNPFAHYIPKRLARSNGAQLKASDSTDTGSRTATASGG